MSNISFSKSIPVAGEYDVLVAGGGPAGIAAAVTAARNGAKVALIEKTGCFGGMGTAGLVPAFTGITDGENFLAGGVGREVFDRLHQANGTGPESTAVIRAEVLKRIYDEMVAAESIHFSFETVLTDVISEGGRVTAVVTASCNGLEALKASVFVDATGDGTLSALAGAEFAIGNEDGKIMPGTLCSLWNNVNWEEFRSAQVSVFDLLTRSFAEDRFFQTPDYHHSGMYRTGIAEATANIGHVYDLDSTDRKNMTDAWVAARALLPEFEAFYRQRVSGFANAQLSSSGSLFGVRESRRIIGDYILNFQDYTKRSRFADEIGHFSYGVDIHPYNPSLEEFQRFRAEFIEPKSHYQKGESYGIPYRILTVKNFKNLLTAGRCVSTDNRMESSIRVMPGCFITGQAAGMAAAMALPANGDVRSFPVPELKERLRKAGAFIKPDAQ
jgi:ribulose 1,5-bisphosphate synthetase/thiazole synthase